MDIIQIVAFAIVASLLTIIIKDQKSSLSFFLVLFTGISIFWSSLDKLPKYSRY